MENRLRSTQRRIRYTNTTRGLAVLMAIALVAAVVLLVTSAAAATEVVAIDTIHRGDPGDLFHEGTIKAVGACTATLTYTNNESQSEHDDTDILVGPATFTDVEHGAFVEAGLTFTGTGTTDVWTRIGGDGVSSGGFTLEVTCNPPTTTTTTFTEPSSTTTIVAPTAPTTSSVPPAPTTTEPAPVGGISTGGGACEPRSQCDGWRLTPLQTWLGLGIAAAWVLGGATAWAFVRGGTRKETPTR